MAHIRPFYILFGGAKYFMGVKRYFMSAPTTFHIFALIRGKSRILTQKPLKELVPP